MQFNNFRIVPEINIVQPCSTVNHQQAMVRLWRNLFPLASANLLPRKLKIISHTKTSKLNAPFSSKSASSPMALGLILACTDTP